MFGINEILEKVINKKNLTEEEKINILRSKRINPKIVKYLISRLSELHIEVLGHYEGSIFELMSNDKLQGWCWQTTESAIVFFNDYDYIERGNLKVDKRNHKYYHSWICFNFKGTEYVFDPCLNFLSKKEDYYKFFDIKVKGKVTAKAVKEELIKQITGFKVEDTSQAHKDFKNIFETLLSKVIYKDYPETVVYGPEDVNTPLYRNGAGYKAELQNGKIKKLTVHYYYIDC